MFSNWHGAQDSCISTCNPAAHVTGNSSETLFLFTTFHPCLRSLTVQWPWWTCLQPSGSNALPESSFCLIFCPSIICFVSKSLSHWKWPGHGSSRRPRHQRHWSKNRWGADQPFGSDCPWQPWRNGRLSKGYLSSHFSPFSTFSNLRNLERLALVFAARKSEAPWLGGVLPVKQPCYLFHAMD